MQGVFTPLRISSQLGHVGVVEMLLKNKANIEATDQVGVVEDDGWYGQMMCVCLSAYVFAKCFGCSD